MTGPWIAIGMVVLLMMGFPLKVPLLAGALALLLTGASQVDPALLVQQMIGGVSPAVLTAVPLFIYAADIMTRGETAHRLLDLVVQFAGHVRGGLPIATAVSCTLFGSVSGSTQATVVAMGQPIRPKLLEAGYSDSFALALIINASDLALLIPPSIGMIVYGVVTGTSVGELFIAGIGPGLLILVLFAGYCRVASHWQRVAPTARASSSERRAAVRRALLPLGFPVVVIGGIYAGVFSPTEAAAVSVAYAVFLEVVVFRRVRWRELGEIAQSTALVTSVVFVLVAAGAAFSWVIAFQQIPQDLLGGWSEAFAEEPRLLLVFICAAYFVGCMFVDPIVVILVLAPVFAPFVERAGLDPVLVGTLAVLQAAIGSATPPFGCDIFTAIAVFRRPYVEVIRGTPPFVALLVGATGLLIAFPPIALLLRDVAFR